MEQESLFKIEPLIRHSWPNNPSPIAMEVLRARYLKKNDQGVVVESPGEMLWRVACAVAEAEAHWGGAHAVREWATRFFRLLVYGMFLPNSPTLINAGRSPGQLSACFVLPIEDSLNSIFQGVKDAALIHKFGGGTGFSFSRLRPAGDLVASTHGVSSGPLSFMNVFDVATQAIMQGGVRRGANMAVLDVSHPDIEHFILAKRQPGVLQNFNLSVMVGQAFLEAVKEGADWPLVNPRNREVARLVSAEALFDLLCEAAHACGEPGLIFCDALNQDNPTPALGALEATNPCGEQPLLPYESCNLGSLVLPAFVRAGEVDYTALEEATTLAVRFLDDVVVVNHFPLPQIEEATLRTRKIGLGVMGFADLLVDLGIYYSSQMAVKLARQIMERIQTTARAASVELARERGSFPAFEQSVWSEQGYTRLRNATVTTVAPTGSLSLIADCSSGIEPYFAMAYIRQMLDGREVQVTNPRFLAMLRQRYLDYPEILSLLAASGSARGIRGLPLSMTRLFANALEICPAVHLLVQEAFQKFTDNAVSKTINLPASTSKDEIKQMFLLAHEMGLKGVTVFRNGCRREQVLKTDAPCQDKQSAGQAEPGGFAKPHHFAANGTESERCQACGL